MTEIQQKSFDETASEIRKEFIEKSGGVKAQPTPKSVDDLRVAFLGKKGRVTTLSEELRNVPKEKRPEAGKAVNTLRQFIEAEVATLQPFPEQRTHWRSNSALGSVNGKKLGRNLVFNSLP